MGNESVSWGGEQQGKSVALVLVVHGCATAREHLSSALSSSVDRTVPASRRYQQGRNKVKPRNVTTKTEPEKVYGPHDKTRTKSPRA